MFIHVKLKISYTGCRKLKLLKLQVYQAQDMEKK